MQLYFCKNGYSFFFKHSHGNINLLANKQFHVMKPFRPISMDHSQVYTWHFFQPGWKALAKATSTHLRRSGLLPEIKAAHCNGNANLRRETMIYWGQVLVKIPTEKHVDFAMQSSPLAQPPVSSSLQQHGVGHQSKSNPETLLTFMSQVCDLATLVFPFVPISF
jgi:hypothetical protein